MCNYVIKTTIFSTILFLPIAILAATCSPNDLNCKREQSQLQAIQNSGIKPSPIAEPPVITKVESKQDQSTQQLQQQPSTTVETKAFEIPLPLSAKPKTSKDLPNRNILTTMPQIKKNKAADEEENTEQGSTTNQQQPGMWYR